MKPRGTRSHRRKERSCPGKEVAVAEKGRSSVDRRVLHEKRTHVGVRRAHASRCVGGKAEDMIVF